MSEICYYGKKIHKGDKLHNGHRLRLKEKFLKNGLDTFDSHEVLELLLFYAIPRKDTNGLAHKLIRHFGSLSGVFDADKEELEKIDGISSSSAILIKMIPSVSRVYIKDRWEEKLTLNSTTLAGEFCTGLFVGVEYESFYLINLTSKNTLINAQEIHKGTISEVVIFPRTVVENVIKNRAHSVILSHNHPGGILKPSKADIVATNKIKEALDSIGVEVKDHIIVAGDSYISFAEKGLL